MWRQTAVSAHLQGGLLPLFALPRHVKHGTLNQWRLHVGPTLNRYRFKISCLLGIHVTTTHRFTDVRTYRQVRTPSTRLVNIVISCATVTTLSWMDYKVRHISQKLFNFYEDSYTWIFWLLLTFSMVINNEHDYFHSLPFTHFQLLFKHMLCVLFISLTSLFCLNGHLSDFSILVS